MQPDKTPPNGTRSHLPTKSVGGVLKFDTAKSLGLITARNLNWGPWALSLDPVTVNGAAPYQWSTSTAPFGSLAYVGDPGLAGHPTVRLSWGVAGILRTVMFDYPLMGGVMVVNANAIEVSVNCNTSEGMPAWTAENQIPTVGAWVVPSAAPSSPNAAYISVENSATPTVPPFAKYLVVSAYKASPAVLTAGEIHVTFSGPSGGVGTALASYRVAFGPGSDNFARVPVPPGAQRCSIDSYPLAVAALTFAMWELSFA